MLQAPCAVICSDQEQQVTLKSGGILVTLQLSGQGIAHLAKRYDR
jgi:hypothetical protein